MILDLAIKAGSAGYKSINDNVLRATKLRYILLDFLAAYAASRSSLTLAASVSSPYRIKCSKNFHRKRQKQMDFIREGILLHTGFI